MYKLGDDTKISNSLELCKTNLKGLLGLQEVFFTHQMQLGDIQCRLYIANICTVDLMWLIGVYYIY